MSKFSNLLRIMESYEPKVGLNFIITGKFNPDHFKDWLFLLGLSKSDLQKMGNYVVIRGAFDKDKLLRDEEISGEINKRLAQLGYEVTYADPTMDFYEPEAINPESDDDDDRESKEKLYWSERLKADRDPRHNYVIK